MVLRIARFVALVLLFALYTGFLALVMAALRNFTPTILTIIGLISCGFFAWVVACAIIQQIRDWFYDRKTATEAVSERMEAFVDATGFILMDDLVAAKNESLYPQGDYFDNLFPMGWREITALRTGLRDLMREHASNCALNNMQPECNCPLTGTTGSLNTRIETILQGALPVETFGAMVKHG